jgi:hypothetical protein
MGRRKFGGMVTMVVFFIWLDFLKVLSHSGLPYTSLGCDVLAGKIKKSKRHNIISLNSREMFYSGNEGIYL